MVYYCFTHISHSTLGFEAANYATFVTKGTGAITRALYLLKVETSCNVYIYIYIYIYIYKSDSPFQVVDSCAESHVLISSSYFPVNGVVYTPQVVIEKKG